MIVRDHQYADTWQDGFGCLRNISISLSEGAQLTLAPALVTVLKSAFPSGRWKSHVFLITQAALCLLHSCNSYSEALVLQEALLCVFIFS